ncbi:MAG: efflux RND transporter permease subunit [Gemmatimonadota bacterium]|nr:efflux RND transporter permease subunit [Gemmatimonadota bacterium]
MDPIRFAINRKTLISMVFIGLSLLGAVSYRQLPMELIPDVEFPFLIVMVTCQRETDPQYMETQAIIPVEGAIGALEGVSSIESGIEGRRGTVRVYLDQSVNLEYAYLKLHERISELAPSLPEEFTVRTVKIDTERLSNTFMSLQVRGSGGLERVRAVIDKSILRELENIEGVSHVEVVGGRMESVEIILDDETARAYRITPGRVRSLIAQNNRQKTFVGHAYEKQRHFWVNLKAEYTDVRELENIIVDPRGPVLLKDIATVVFGLKEETSFSRVNGKDAVTVQLVRDANVNLISLSHAARNVVDRLNEDLVPQDIEIVVQRDSAEEMEKNIDLIMNLALLGGALAVLILWFFIRNIRLVVTVLLAIPVSILVSLNLFYAFGLTINSLTLIGMALAVGMLLDNSIVVLENIYRHISRGRDRTAAVLTGTREVWRSIVAATLTTVTVFLPFVFSSNFLVRVIGRHIGISIVSTLLVSLAAALLLIPMITHGMLGSTVRQVSSFGRISQKNRLLQIYTLLLKTAIRFPARTVLGVVAAFFVSIAVCIALSLNVAQEVELREFNLYVTMPRGSTLDHTDNIVRDLENRLGDVEEIRDVIATVYEEEASLTVVLEEEYEKIDNRTIPQVKELIQSRSSRIRSAEVSMTEPRASGRYGGGMGRNPAGALARMFGIGAQSEKIIIKGNDFALLRKMADDIEFYLEQLSPVDRAERNISGNRPEIHILFDSHLLSYNDIPVSSVSAELASFQSEVSSGIKYKQGTDEYDIIIRNSSLEEDKTMDDLRSLRIPNRADATFELEGLSRIIYSAGMSSISRLNREKQIEISYRFDSEVNDSKPLLDAARQEVDQLIAALSIPSGVAVEVVHDDTDYEEFYFLIGAAFILIYMILASVFESLVTPVVIMFTIPLATVGAFWALILTGNSLLNANSMIGFLILIGVVVNNGVILIDYTNILRRRGYRRSRALLEAGQARVRPILITAITTIVAMIPLAMGKAEYVTHLGAPFAITVIGGLALSTLFTLVLIPTVYSGLESTLEWLRRLDWKIKLIQCAGFASCCALIYYNIDSLLWRSAWLIFSLAAVPGLTWFIMTSLRQARSDYLGREQEIVISIRRLAKTYDSYSRFIREWKKGERMSRRAGASKAYASRRDLDQLYWQVPLLGFIIYFVYFYIQSQGWLFILSHAVFFFVLLIWKPVALFLAQPGRRTGRVYYRRLGTLLARLFVWGFPLLNLALFYFSRFRTEVLVFIALLWYGALIIYMTSDRLRREKVNIMRLTGRFAGLRRHFYRLVRAIPVIGKKRSPFKALDGVSLKITSGMFGLLGPNGAGKTTMMRMICGVLDQNLGTVRINDIEFRQKREELQGLIGYLPQEFGTYENMTAHDFLDYIAILKNIYDREERQRIVSYAIESVHLGKERDRKIKTFSGGMKQRIGIAMTILHLPRILVVDEPTAGLDPRERIRFRNLLVELSRDRIVIFSTHIIEDISSSCNRVAVLDKGALHYLGDPGDMARAALGNVWQFHVDSGQFGALRNELWIVHHTRDGDRIRVRSLARSCPHPGAVQVQPTLEDAYLWLLGKKSVNQ